MILCKSNILFNEQQQKKNRHKLVKMKYRQKKENKSITAGMEDGKACPKQALTTMENQYISQYTEKSTPK